jgi:hypothetical protein
MPPDETVVPSGNHTGRLPLPSDSAAATTGLQRRYNELATLMHVTSALFWGVWAYTLARAARYVRATRARCRRAVVYASFVVPAMAVQAKTLCAT